MFQHVLRAKIIPLQNIRLGIRLIIRQEIWQRKHKAQVVVSKNIRLRHGWGLIFKQEEGHKKRHFRTSAWDEGMEKGEDEDKDEDKAKNRQSWCRNDEDERTRTWNSVKVASNSSRSLSVPSLSWKNILKPPAKRDFEAYPEKKIFWSLSWKNILRPILQ